MADDETLDRLEAENRVVFRYVDRDGEATDEANPNGSARNIAGIINEAGNILGLMPHPERHSLAVLGDTDGLGVFDRSATRSPAEGGAYDRDAAPTDPDVRPFEVPFRRRGAHVSPATLKSAHAEITPEAVAAHGLSPEEWEQILEIMGRQPTIAELGVFSAMWSEHCGYKNSTAAAQDAAHGRRRVVTGAR